MMWRTGATHGRASLRLLALLALPAASVWLGLSVSPAMARGRAAVVSELIHCTEAGESPKRIAHKYGVSARNLARSSGAVQRLNADVRTRRKRYNKAKRLAKKRYKIKLRRWRKKPRRKRGARPKFTYPAFVPPVFRAYVAVRVKRPRRRVEVRDAVLRLRRGASVRWVAKRFKIAEGLVRCANLLGPKVRGVRCKRRRIRYKSRKAARGRPRFTTTCDGGRRWLTVRLPFPKPAPQAVGGPNAGHLRHGEAFPRVPGTVVKQPKNAYGVAAMTTRIIDAVAQVQKVHADSPDLVIGDIAHKKGGRFPPHKSHQNGLDADIGYYHVPKVRRDRFTKVTAKNLDRARTWTLLKRLLESGEVQYIFISTSVQRLLLPYVRQRRRADRAWCLRFLRAQARPHGRRARGSKKRARRRRGPSGWQRCVRMAFAFEGDSRALIRHAKGHDDHLHLRLYPRR